ncbi:MAG: molybdopterin molybdotransferase MoeA [Actinobacteria bacterium]|nr:MAG: molybdopterin molybdotransferase MoeA [Actinomycetota bacterium]
MPDLLSLADARTAVLARAHPLPAEDVAVGQSAGRVLAADARAAVDLPPFDASAMDGFALRARDTPGVLPVVARIAAGVPADTPLAPGSAMGIATGGVVPAGAEAVIPLEDVVDRDNEIEVGRPVDFGDNVRPRGGDLRAGDVVVARGTRLAPAQVGALAAAGCASVSCGRRPAVAIVATGTELRRPGEPLEPGQVYEANGSMLAAALAAANAIVDEVPFVVDDEAAHRQAVERALEADVVVTSGGVSVGPHDLVRAVERELGVDEVFWGVAVKPGKPVSFGVRGDTLVFGLPGNPVSSLVAAELFVRPALLALQGSADPGPPYEPGRLASAVRRDARRDELLRARRIADAGAVVLEPVTGQESHMIARAATADALVLVPRGEGTLPAGAAVSYLRLA